MRVEDLAYEELLELDPRGGVIRFAGQRALLVDAVAMGLLRQSLVDTFGVTATRAVLTQFGFAHGWRMAAAMKAQFGQMSDAEWRRAGPHVHNLEGLFETRAGNEDPLAREGSTLLSSYEAEQHLLHFGRANAPVCWTICGLISGYMSQVTGEQVFVLEDRCVGQGDAACHLVGRTRDQWGEDRSADLAFFDATRLDHCLGVSLHEVIASLKDVERKLDVRRRALVRVERDVEAPLGIVAKSTGMRDVLDLARRVAQVDTTVLITGESGVGKERIARLVHDTSPRSAGPFLAVNCGAITETLLEAELFGHKRGAFTGASADRPGLFESANRGTLFLDEIGDVSPAMQRKLLRVLQEREIRRVGENVHRPVDVRVLAATNRNLTTAIVEGTFRQDLYYRLKVVELYVPPLRERQEDILPLARVLLTEAALRMARKVTGLTPRAADQLARHRWPGNVRELENAMERAAALARGGRVDLEDLPQDVREALAKPVPSEDGRVQSLREVEKDYIVAVMALNDGNQARTAEQLEIGTATLYRKLKDYGMTRPRHPAKKARHAAD